MANEKKTSIYSDRGTIGSPEELDEYGVWVKSDPQDLSSIDFDYQKTPEEPGLEMDFPDFGDDLAGEDLAPLPHTPGEDLPEFDAGLESFPKLDDTDDMGDFDINIPEETFSEALPDFDLPPEPREDSLTPDRSPSAEDLPEFEGFGKDPGFSGGFFPEFEVPFTEEDLDEADMPQDETPFSFETDDIDDIFEDPLEVEDQSPPRLEETPDAFSPQEFEPPLTDVSMEDFLDNTSSGSVPPLLDDPVAEPPFSANPPGEDEAVSKGSDLSTKLLMRIADELSSIKMEISTLKEELSLLHRTGGMPPREEPKKDKEPGFFNEDDNEKIALTGDEINNILSTADFIEEAGTDAAEDFPEGLPSEDLVPEDLSPEGLPSEDLPPEDLLPEDLSPEGLPSEDLSPEEAALETLPEISFEELPETPEEAAPEPVLAEAPVEDAGDTEGGETGEEPAGTEDFGGTSPELSPEELKDFEFLELDDDFSDIELLDIPGDSGLPPEEPEGLKLVLDGGSPPLTEAPEDTSYLEGESLDEESLAADSFDGEVLDLTDAVIDEPNISGNLVENVLQEPSPDSIAINLDMEEPLIPEADDDEAEDEDEPLEALVDEIGDLFIEDENAVELFHENDVKPIDPAAEPAATGREDLAALPPEEEVLAVFPENLAEEADVSPEPLDQSPVAEEALEFSPEPVSEGAAESTPAGGGPSGGSGARPLPDNLKQELKVVLSYMDQLLESLPDEKIEEFARSEHFNTYKKLFEELGLM